MIIPYLYELSYFKTYDYSSHIHKFAVWTRSSKAAALSERKSDHSKDWESHSNEACKCCTRNEVNGSSIQGLYISVVSISFRKCFIVLPSSIKHINLFSRDGLRVIDDDPIHELSAWRSGQRALIVVHLSLIESVNDTLQWDCSRLPRHILARVINIKSIDQITFLIAAQSNIEQDGQHTVWSLVSVRMHDMQFGIVVLPIESMLWRSVQVELKNTERFGHTLWV